MMKATTTAARSPRGTKPVSQAFFAALETIPEATRAAVAKAALAMIRDEMKLRKEKTKAAAAKEKARTPAAKPAGRTAKAAAPKAKAARTPKAAKPAPAPETHEMEGEEAPAPKRRGRKPAETTPAT